MLNIDLSTTCVTLLLGLIAPLLILSDCLLLGWWLGFNGSDTNFVPTVCYLKFKIILIHDQTYYYNSFSSLWGNFFKAHSERLFTMFNTSVSVFCSIY